jgi:hypothetical protein
MPLRIVEWFGHDLTDWSQLAIENRNRENCPFIGGICTKTFNDKSISGVCSVQQTNAIPIVICPNRLYANDYSFLTDVATLAFGLNMRVIHPSQRQLVAHDGQNVVKRFGKELRLPSSRGTQAYFVDWILARLNNEGDLSEFVAIEVQSIDTTGSYRPEVQKLRAGIHDPGPSDAGLNWENVNKRILPQIIFKSHVLRQEPLCTKGLFFVCPTPIYNRINVRLGGHLRPYPNMQPGSISFVWYDMSFEVGQPRALSLGGRFSTTADQGALAFSSPSNPQRQASMRLQFVGRWRKCKVEFEI